MVTSAAITLQSLVDMAETARRIAVEAGLKGMEWFRKPVTIEVKTDQSPVTEADRAVETVLRDRIRAAFPGHAILGEEFGLEGRSDAPVWVVDPIDGTRSFITGWPIWGTLMSMAEEGRSRLGVLHMPALGETWVAHAGGDCLFHAANGRVDPARTSGCEALADARFYTTSPDYFDATERAGYDAIRRATGVQRFGGDCYAYGLLASGHVDLVVESRLQPYDFLALAPVVEQAGGVISDWQGRPLGIGSGEQVIAAATPALHREALALIAG
ncbi:histidinol-phosphatase [Pseudogemmobacter bohemicus]|uniref:histidinol-phosphatase n=1 Tax=Pseudogemmobacter bohemicus TaxID=2250708 RepID=UPI000DD3366C|nr:histidinol-phosphatase [Pseudogemmobacter bohemicus]